MAKTDPVLEMGPVGLCPDGGEPCCLAFYTQLCRLVVFFGLRTVQEGFPCAIPTTEMVAVRTTDVTALTIVTYHPLPWCCRQIISIVYIVHKL